MLRLRVVGTICRNLQLVLALFNTHLYPLNGLGELLQHGSLAEGLKSGGGGGGAGVFRSHLPKFTLTSRERSTYIVSKNQDLKANDDPGHLRHLLHSRAELGAGQGRWRHGVPQHRRGVALQRPFLNCLDPEGWRSVLFGAPC